MAVERVRGEVVDEQPPRRPLPPEVEVASLVLGMGRIAIGAWWRTTRWGVGFGVRTGGTMARAAITGESVTEVLEEAGSGLRSWLRETLGIVDVEERLRQSLPQVLGMATPNGSPPAPVAEEAVVRTLRERGAALLRASADLTWEEPAHPAYERILGSLAPDEARILRFLHLNGAQPSVDVRSGLPIGPASQLVAPGINMVGAEAGCRFLDRVPAYLNNLYRLGLIWFSREQLEDRLRYQVLEAQPEVVEALRARGRGRTVRRSIQLTPFGEDFCEICLPVSTEEIELPEPAPDAAEDPDAGRA